MHIKHETIISNPKVEIVRYIVLGEDDIPDYKQEY